jgi:hypothetical protein
MLKIAHLSGGMSLSFLESLREVDALVVSKPDRLASNTGASLAS